MLTLRTFFEEKEAELPQVGLEKKIFQAVLVVRNQEMKHRLMTSYAGIAASLGAFLYASLTFGKTLIESDFWNIISLIFSDLTVAVRYSNDFFFSLLETFPAFSVASVLLPIFVFLLFLNMYAGIEKRQYSFSH